MYIHFFLYIYYQDVLGPCTVRLLQPDRVGRTEFGVSYSMKRKKNMINYKHKKYKESECVFYTEKEN